MSLKSQLIFFTFNVLLLSKLNVVIRTWNLVSELSIVNLYFKMQRTKTRLTGPKILFQLKASAKYSAHFICRCLQGLDFGIGTSFVVRTAPTEYIACTHTLWTRSAYERRSLTNFRHRHLLASTIKHL